MASVGGARPKAEDSVPNSTPHESSLLRQGTYITEPTVTASNKGSKNSQTGYKKNDNLKEKQTIPIVNIGEDKGSKSGESPFVTQDYAANKPPVKDNGKVNTYGKQGPKSPGESTSNGKSRKDIRTNGSKSVEKDSKVQHLKGSQKDKAPTQDGSGSNTKGSKNITMDRDTTEDTKNRQNNSKIAQGVGKDKNIAADVPNGDQNSISHTPEDTEEVGLSVNSQSDKSDYDSSGDTKRIDSSSKDNNHVGHTKNNPDLQPPVDSRATNKEQSDNSSKQSRWISTQNPHKESKEGNAQNLKESENKLEHKLDSERNDEGSKLSNITTFTPSESHSSDNNESAQDINDGGKINVNNVPVKEDQLIEESDIGEKRSQEDTSVAKNNKVGSGQHSKENPEKLSSEIGETDNVIESGSLEGVNKEEQENGLSVADGGNGKTREGSIISTKSLEITRRNQNRFLQRPMTRNNHSSQSQRSVFSKKNGEPVYANPNDGDDDEDGDVVGHRPSVAPPSHQLTKTQISIKKEAWSDKPIDDTSKASTDMDVAHEKSSESSESSKALPSVFGAATLHKKKEQSAESDQNSGTPEANLESVAANFWDRINKTESENDRLKEENDILLGKLKYSEDRERKASEENVLLRSEMTDVTAHYHKAKDEGDELRKKINSINAEHRKFVKQLEEQAQDLQKDIEQGKNDVEILQSDLREKEHLLAKLKSDHSIETAKLNTEIDKCKELEDDKKELEKQNAEMKSREEMLEKLSSKNAAEITKLNNIITNLRGEIEMLKAENEKLKSEKEEKANKDEEVKKNVIEMEELYEKMLKEKLKAESAQRDLENKVALLEKEKEFSAWDNERLKLQIGDLENRISAMKKTEDALQKLIEDKQLRVEDLQKQIIDLKNLNNKYMEEIDDLKDDNKSDQVRDSKYDDMQKAHLKLLDENKRLRTQLAHKTIMQTNNDTEKDELRIRLDKTETKLETAENRVKQMEGWLDEIYTNKDMLGGDNTARNSTISLPDIARSVISDIEPSPSLSLPVHSNKPPKKKTVGYGIPYSSRFKNKYK